jgi:hypothetical protein
MYCSSVGGEWEWMVESSIAHGGAFGRASRKISEAGTHAVTGTVILCKEPQIRGQIIRAKRKCPFTEIDIRVRDLLPRCPTIRISILMAWRSSLENAQLEAMNLPVGRAGRHIVVQEFDEIENTDRKGIQLYMLT